MATSGNTSWELQSTALVTAAYRKLGYLPEGATLDSNALANGVEALNAIVSMMVTRGMPLWKRTTQVLVPSATNQVYNITNAVKVTQVVLTFTNGSQYPLVEKSRYDFNMLPSNAAAGTPVHYTVQPTIADSTLSIWPLTADAGTIANASLSVYLQKKFDGFFNATDTLDFPSYWTHAIIFSLAASLSHEVGIPLADRGVIKGEAESALAMASGYGDEDGSLFLMPDYFGNSNNGIY